jgi:UDP-N-acetylmuramoylalanine--D-glutamate ligase
MRDLLQKLTCNREVLILGYGREGISTLRSLKEACPGISLTVADADSSLPERHPELREPGIRLMLGAPCPADLRQFELVIKSPGISLNRDGIEFIPENISSQTDIFLRAYAAQTIAVTGTKGKSTTTGLLYRILSAHTPNALIAGNMGIPLFDLAGKIDPQTRIVCELSSHQLEYITRGPATGILLNLYQEHLDHYRSFKHYQLSKFGMALRQTGEDVFIYDHSDINIHALLREFTVPGKVFPVYARPFEGDGIGISGAGIVIRHHGRERLLLPAGFKTNLRGEHNLRNIMAAAAAASLSGIPAEAIETGVAGFQPLEHRLEFVGTFNGKSYYNDSISTIPEAAMAAVRTLKNVNTLILGGFDRGIDYRGLVEYLGSSPVKQLVLTGPAGERMQSLMKSVKPFWPAVEYQSGFDRAVGRAMELTPEGGTCLLSPAASSYDSFRNFEERGHRFRTLVSLSVEIKS